MRAALAGGDAECRRRAGVDADVRWSRAGEREVFCAEVIIYVCAVTRGNGIAKHHDFLDIAAKEKSSIKGIARADIKRSAVIGKWH